MQRVLWRRVRGGTPGARLFAAYIAIVLAVALIGPMVSVYAAEGEETITPAPVVEEPAPEVPDEPVAEEPEAPPAEDPAEDPVEAPAEDAVEDPAEDAVEAPTEDTVEDPAEDALEEIAPVEIAAIVDPILVEDPLGPPDEGCVRIEDPDHEEATVYDVDGAEIEVTITYDEEEGYSFCFEVLTEGFAVSKVVVKGGPDANSYEYDPPVTEDCGLHAPALESNGMWPEISHIDFCLVEVEPPETGDLEVCKFEDLDEDGEWDEEDEPLLEDWEFTVYDEEDNVLDSGMTGEDGCITFEDLPVGDVWVTETLQEGWMNTTDLTQMAEIVEGETATLYFGNIPEEEETGDLEVCKFEDLDEDGEWDEEDEPLLEGWEFTVYDEEENVLDSGMTGEDGCITFEDLPVGDVWVTETLQDGWMNTTDLTQMAEIEEGETATLYFGNIPEEEETGDLLVHKFEDLDEDGEWDEEDEPLLEGWEFTVYDEEDNVLDSGMTDEDGMVLFEDLPVGDVWVTETLQEGWMNTTDLTQMAEIVEGETAHLFFGNITEVVPPEFGDVVVFKFRDANRNGVADSGEAMLSGWEFKIYKNGLLVGTATTNAIGRVDFPDLESGTYTVIETPKSGWTNTTPLSRTIVVVDNQTVTLYYGNIEVVEPFAPFTPSAPFLPFTGGDPVLLLAAAAAAATMGALLRRRLR